MAISQRAAGTWVFNGPTDPRQVAIPAGYQAGDLGIYVGVWKPFDVSATIDQGWTILINEATGSTATGVGLGSLRLFVAYKELSASETNPTVDRASAPSPEMNVIVVFQKGADETWNIAQLSNAVEQAMSNTSLVNDCTTIDAISSGDWVFALTGVADDSATFTRGTTGILNGPTWSGDSVEYPATHASTTAGNDGAADLVYRVASGSMSSGGTVRVAGTLSAAERVGSILFKVWATASTPPDPISGSGGVSFGAPSLSATGAQTFASSGGVSFGPAALAATGAETFSGSGGVTFGPVTLDGSGEVDLGNAITGSGGVAFGPVSMSATGWAFGASGGVAFGPASLAATGAETFSGSGGVSFGAPALAAIGAETFSGSGGVSFGAPSLAATGSVLINITGSGGVTFGPVVLSAVGETDVPPITGEGGVAFGVPTIYGWMYQVTPKETELTRRRLDPRPKGWLI